MGEDLRFVATPFFDFPARPTLPPRMDVDFSPALNERPRSRLCFDLINSRRVAGRCAALDGDETEPRLHCQNVAEAEQVLPNVRVGVPVFRYGDGIALASKQFKAALRR